MARNALKGTKTMNKDILQGKWTEIKGKIRSKWGELTDDELTQINGDSERLFGLLQKRYGLSRSIAEKQVSDLVSGDKAARSDKEP
jgi:uncharacterized protein YjbJ (UPF0337 family)